MLKLKKCTKCKIERPYTKGWFYKCSKTKSGLAAKCKTCANKESKIYMRRSRLASRLKQCGLYDGRISKLLLEKLNKDDLVDMCFELSRQLLYSNQKSRFCVKCEQWHQSGHKNHPKTKPHNTTGRIKTVINVEGLPFIASIRNLDGKNRYLKIKKRIAFPYLRSIFSKINDYKKITIRAFKKWISLQW